MSEVKVNKISPRSGTAITLGDSGDTFTIPSGATLAIAGSVTGFTSAGIDDNATSVAITIDSSERVGIGSTSPSTKLTINEGGEPPAEGMLLLQANSSQRQLRISPPSDSANGKIDYRGGNLTFQDDGTEVARFQGTTGFGIGTSAPSRKLQVVQDSTSAGGIYLYSNAVHTGTDTNALLAVRSDSNNGSNNGDVVNIQGDGVGDLLVLNNNGTDRVTVQADGRVGIGTASPAAILHVDASGGASVQISRTSQGALYLESDGTNGNIRSTSSSGSLSFQTNGNNEKMRITSAGLVGIGTSTPQTIFHILQTAETVDSGIKIVGSSSPVSGRIYMNNTDIHIDNATAGQNTGITLDTAGQTGIGTASPSTTLDVNGTIKATGFDGANAPAWSAKRNSAQTGIANSAAVTIICDVEDFDTDSAYNTSTGIFTVPSGKGGKYMVGAGYRTNGSGTATRIATSIFVGSNVVRQTNFNQVSSGEASGACHAVLNLSAGNEVSFKIFQDSGSAVNAEADGKTYFYGYKIG